MVINTMKNNHSISPLNNLTGFVCKDNWCRLTKYPDNHCQALPKPPKDMNLWRPYILDQPSDPPTAYRYFIRYVLGKGSFGQVVRATELETNRDYAIKLLDATKHPGAIESEISTLKLLQEHNADQNFITYITDFTYGSMRCIVFELLGPNLYELLKENNFVGLPFHDVIHVGLQLVRAVCKLNDLRIIHCDIKPENIALSLPTELLKVKLIDFGSSCGDGKTIYKYIQSRFYRAPEVVLGLAYSLPIDVWSVACVIAELLIGSPIFPGCNELEQLYFFVQCLGSLPLHMMEKCTKFNSFFIKDYNQIVLLPTPIKHKTLPLSILLSQSRSANTFLLQYPHATQRLYYLVDLLAKMLIYDPNLRLSPHECINHPFFGPDCLSDFAFTSGVVAYPIVVNSHHPIQVAPIGHPIAYNVHPLVSSDTKYIQNPCTLRLAPSYNLSHQSSRFVINPVVPLQYTIPPHSTFSRSIIDNPHNPRPQNVMPNYYQSHGQCKCQSCISLRMNIHYPTVPP